MRKLNSTKHVISVLTVALFIFLALASGDDKKDKSGSSASTATDAPKAPDNWTYSSDTDKMTSKVVYYAETPAKDGLKLKFPYEGSTGYLSLVNRSGKPNVVIGVSKGQILAANAIDGGHILVRFDEDPAEKYSVVGASDGSTETVFINNEDKFLKRLKTSKKLLVEIEFYDNGSQQMEFNTSNLVWN